MSGYWKRPVIQAIRSSSACGSCRFPTAISTNSTWCVSPASWNWRPAAFPVKSEDGLTPEQQLIAIAEAAGHLVDRQQRCWADLQKRLRAEGISILGHASLASNDRAWLCQLLVDRLLPVLTPIAIDPAHPFPF